ncbi:beta-defensin 122-like [Perognathus longimembris pacificus]|uniref:beta-defensin 122-like n=1 Tax=Perognathus longimembris pacificus TaxID=214514 RepID=UPI00201901E0|nr:beta-defensin 122-like [Perognathus longimembris pacificus]
MKPVLLTLVLLLLCSQVIPGSMERCWNSRGACRELCTRNERVFIFCPSGKLCCVKPRNQPQLVT